MNKKLILIASLLMAGGVYAEIHIYCTTDSFFRNDTMTTESDERKLLLTLTDEKVVLDEYESQSYKWQWGANNMKNTISWNDDEQKNKMGDYSTLYLLHRLTGELRENRFLIGRTVTWIYECKRVEPLF